MNSLRLAMVILSLLLLRPSITEAHTIFKKPFQKKYNFTTVSCYACHAKGQDENGQRLGKEALNDLGKAMKKAMAGREVTKRINTAKEADRTTETKVHAEVTKEFLEALKMIETMRSPESKTTWGVLLKDGRIEGIKKRTPTS